MSKKILIIAILLAAVLAGEGGYWWYVHQKPAGVEYKTPEEADVYARFDMEVYDKVLANYWQNASDADLSELFRLSLAKAASTSPDTVVLETADRAGTAKMLGKALAGIADSEAKRQLALDTAIVALYNLAPVGRNGLLSTSQVTNLRNEEKNVNPSSDLYGTLGVAKDATAAAIDAAFSQKKAALSASTSPEAKQKLAQVSYALQVLADPAARARYDGSGAEPTVFAHVLGGKTLYLYVEKISPSTLQEFGTALLDASTSPVLDSMIIDLRGNIGGTFDFVQNFLGLFIGRNQYAFDTFHRGDYEVARTMQDGFDALRRFREIAVLTDSMTQSSAELTAAVLKRFNLAHIVGSTTRGWGSVENTYPIATEVATDTTYSLLLVNSLTLGADNQPIEGRGVEPDVAVSDPNWKKELGNYFTSRSLIDALFEEAAKPPLR